MQGNKNLSVTNLVGCNQTELCPSNVTRQRQELLCRRELAAAECRGTMYTVS